MLDLSGLPSDQHMLPVRQFALTDITPTIPTLALRTATTDRAISSVACLSVQDLGITGDTRRGSGIAEFTAVRDGVGPAGRDMLHAEPMIGATLAASPAAKSTPTMDSMAAQFEAVAASMEVSGAKHSH